MFRVVSLGCVLVFVISCSEQEPLVDLEPTGCAGYESRGPFTSGVATLDLDGVPVEVWYPSMPAATAGMRFDQYDMRDWLPEVEREKIPDSDTPWFEMQAYRDAQAAPDRFPVVLFSHGMGGYRSQSSFLMTHLASWGFVVAAPEHPERGLSVLVEKGVPTGDDAAATLRATLQLLEQANEQSGGFLEGRLDLNRVGLAGHSAGGAAVLDVARDEGIDAWMTLASGGFGTGGGPAIPSMMMAGAHDGIAIADSIEQAFNRQASDKRMVTVSRMGHLGFTDICAVGRDRGGVLQIAVEHGVNVPELLLTLGRDGCTEEDLEPESGWRVVNHYTTAQLKYALSGTAPAGLNDEAAECFAGDVANYRHD